MISLDDLPQDFHATIDADAAELAGLLAGLLGVS